MLAGIAHVQVDMVGHPDVIGGHVPALAEPVDGPLRVLDKAQRFSERELDLEVRSLLVVRGDGVLWIRQLELLDVSNNMLQSVSRSTSRLSNCAKNLENNSP